MTRRLTAAEWIARRKERQTKCCITKGCNGIGTRRGLCRQCYMWYPYDQYMAGAPVQGRKLRSDGYVDIQVDGVWCLEHRAIIMKELGRRLTRSELVKHVNGCTADNRRENLVLKTRAEAYRDKET